MGRSPRKAILFLDVEPGSRAAEATRQFNEVAAKLGLPFQARVQLLPIPADVKVDERTLAMIAMNRADCEVSLDSLEFWDIPKAVDPSLIEREISKLVARLLGGRVVADDALSTRPKKEPPKKVHTAKVGRETAGRRGKGVTTIFELALTENQLKELATALKQKCGTGGTVKDGRIEIQGDHRDRIVAELEKLGYKVKRAGG